MSDQTRRSVAGGNEEAGLTLSRIAQMDAGPEMDVAVLEHVFGAKWLPSGSPAHEILRLDPEGATLAIRDRETGTVTVEDDGEAWPYAYSTDWGAFGNLVEEIDRRGFHWQINTPFWPGAACNAGFTQHNATGWNGRPDYPGLGRTVMEAGCRAALVFALYGPDALPPEMGPLPS